MEIINRARNQGQIMLSESESKKVLAEYNIPVTREISVNNRMELLLATREIGFPLVLKGHSPEIAHKTESGLIQINISNQSEACKAFDRIMEKMDAGGNILVQEMIQGQRELMVGMTRDPQFGPCVMFGLGGIFTEILRDVVFRVAPLEKRDAMEMMQEIRGHKILNAVRGMKAVDLDILADIIIGAGRIGIDHDAVKEIDINPLIVSGSKSVAVDALIILEDAQNSDSEQ